MGDTDSTRDVVDFHLGSFQPSSVIHYDNFGPAGVG